MPTPLPNASTSYITLMSWPNWNCQIHLPKFWTIDSCDRSLIILEQLMKGKSSNCVNQLAILSFLLITPHGAMPIVVIFERILQELVYFMIFRMNSCLADIPASSIAKATCLTTPESSPLVIIQAPVVCAAFRIPSRNSCPSLACTLKKTVKWFQILLNKEGRKIFHP